MNGPFTFPLWMRCKLKQFCISFPFFFWLLQQSALKLVLFKTTYVLYFRVVVNFMDSSNLRYISLPGMTYYQGMSVFIFPFVKCIVIEFSNCFHTFLYFSQVVNIFVSYRSIKYTQQKYTCTSYSFCLPAMNSKIGSHTNLIHYHHN